VQKKNPFTISGGIGASANFYTSNEPLYSQTSYSWNVYGNFTPKINKILLPFSFVINQYGNSNRSPYIQMGISPTYKWAKLHLGYHYIRFSPLIYDGQSFRGVGIELNPKLFRFAAFYGKLNKAVNEDTTSGRFRLPQYSRTGYGVKIGIGNLSRYVDLVYFHAKDDSSSASFVKDTTKNYIRAQENAVLGTSFKLTMVKKLILTGDFAISGLIQDQSFDKRGLDSSNPGLRKFIRNFLHNNASTLANYAGQSSLSFYNRNFNSNLGYRRVQPNFKSLGTPYMINDIELISWLNNFSGKINVSTSLSHQHNNLDNTLPVEMRTQVGNFNINTILGQHFNLNFNYSGYNLKQKNNDTLLVKDESLLNQLISQFSFNPSYNVTKDNKLHYISGNFSLQTLKDKNPTTSPYTNSNNLSSSLNYTLAFVNKPISFSLNYLYSRYKQEANSYTSNGVTLGTSSQLLKNKSLNVQGNIGYYFNRFRNSLSSTQKNISYSVNASYYIKHHSFNLFANYVYTPPNNAITNAINSTFPYAVATKNLYGGVSYNYSF